VSPSESSIPVVQTPKKKRVYSLGRRNRSHIKEGFMNRQPKGDTDCKDWVHDLCMKKRSKMGVGREF